MNYDIEKLVKKYGNDYELGKRIRRIYWKIIKDINLSKKNLY